MSGKAAGSIASGEHACVYLRWDDWPSSNQDYDLRLYRKATQTLVTFSENPQSGSQSPLETLCYTNSGVTQDFAVVISRFSATSAPRFDLFSGGPTLEYQTPAGSIIEPASSPNAMAVGAICWQDDSLRSYSSRGPTVDGRTKPDIAGQDGTSSATYGSSAGCSGGFTGTSASAPHVAGAAALVKQANPSFGPSQLQSFLEGRAVDLGAGGKDNSYGSGKLVLGTPPPTCDSVTIAASPSSPQDVGATVTLTATPAAGCSGTEYRFGDWTASGGASIIRGWDSSPTFAWDSAGASGGTHYFIVWMRQGGSVIADKSVGPYTLN